MARLRFLRRDDASIEQQPPDEQSAVDGTDADVAVAPADDAPQDEVDGQQAVEDAPEPAVQPVKEHAPVDEPPEPAEQQAPPPPPKPVSVRRPPASVLRRERRELQQLREQRLRDLGGLLLEMYRRATFREELLSEQCADLVGIETRLSDIEAALTAPRRRAPRCTCGARLLPGARFCASCGRPLAREPIA